MRVKDVIETLDLAPAVTGVDRVRVEHKPRLLSDNGPCYVAKDLAIYLKEHGLGHTRGRSYHPMTQARSSATDRALPHHNRAGGNREDLHAAAADAAEMARHLIERGLAWKWTERRIGPPRPTRSLPGPPCLPRRGAGRSGFLLIGGGALLARANHGHCDVIWIATRGQPRKLSKRLGRL